MVMDIDEGSRPKKASKEETKEKPKLSKLLERAKEVGRVGPNIVKMDVTNASA
jgi:hypothetical protein